MLNISGFPNRAKASSSAARQNDVSIVLEMCHARTARLAQSMILTRQREPRPMGRYVSGPDVVRSLDCQIAQELRENLVARRRLRRSRFRSKGRDGHQAHQPLRALAVDGLALGPQHRPHPARAEERQGMKNSSMRRIRARSLSLADSRSILYFPT